VEAQSFRTPVTQINVTIFLMERLKNSINEDFAQNAFLASVALVAFAFGFFAENVNLKILFISIVTVVGLCLLLLPYRWAISIFFIYLGFEGMAKILVNYHPVIHVGADILITLLCIKWFLSRLILRKSVFTNLPPLSTLFALHFTWFAIAFFNPYSLGLYPSLAGVKVYVTMFTLYAFGYYLATDIKQIHRFMGVWLLVAAIQVVTSLYQASVGPESVLSISPYYAKPLLKHQGYAFRPFGTTANAGASSIFLSVTGAFMAYFLIAYKKMIPRILMLLLVPLSVFTLLLCQVRSALVKFILGSGLFLMGSLRRGGGKGRVRALGAVAVLAGLLIFALPTLTTRWSSQQSDTMRAIERSVSIFDAKTVRHARRGVLDRIILFAKEVPLGAGLSRTGSAGGKFQNRIKMDLFFPEGFFTDNFWAATIVDLGIPGSLILSIIIFTILFRGYRSYRQLKSLQLVYLNVAFLSALIPIVIGLWGAEGVIYNPEAAFFWFFSGVMLKLPTLDT